MKYFREVQNLVEDGLIEKGASYISVAPDNITEVRSPVVVEVLRKLPEQEYQTLKDRRIWFFSPHTSADGWNGPILSDKSQVIYLSPLIEEFGRKDCILIAAHEIAHSLLGHTDSTPAPELEAEAWKKVVHLGFGTEQEVQDFLSRHGGGLPG